MTEEVSITELKSEIVDGSDNVTNPVGGSSEEVEDKHESHLEVVTPEDSSDDGNIGSDNGKKVLDDLLNQALVSLVSAGEVVGCHFRAWNEGFGGP